MCNDPSHEKEKIFRERERVSIQIQTVMQKKKKKVTHNLNFIFHEEGHRGKN